jgi:hypothetical protein
MLMRPSKFKLILGIGMMTVLLWGRAGADPSKVSSNDTLTAGQIFETVRENYASLSSYSDQGRILTTMDSTVMATDFATRLGRPGLYRIEWDQYSEADTGVNTNLQGAWCCGVGDYAQTGWAVRKQYDRGTAFANLTTSSAGAVVDIPRFFFGMQDYGAFASEKIIGLERLADDKIGKLDCYQLAGQSVSGETKTFWIGKQDLLIHQIRTEVSTNLMRAAWSGTVVAGLNAAANYYGFSSIQTYTNIVVDKPYLRADFAPTLPLYQVPNF